MEFRDNKKQSSLSIFKLSNQHMPTHSSCHNITRGRWDALCITLTMSPHLLAFMFNWQFEARKDCIQEKGGIMAHSVGASSNEETWQWSTMV
jgi:hypothetical protein